MDGDDTGEELVFREVKGTSVTTLTLHSQVVDINVDQEALQKLQAGNLTDTTHILTICWDSVEYQQCASICEIHFPSRQDTMVKAVVSRLAEQHYGQLRSLVETFYRKFNTRVAYVHHNPLSFGLLHRSLDEFQHLKASLIPLETLFMTLYKDITKARLQIKLVDKGSDSCLPSDKDDGQREEKKDDIDGQRETSAVSRGECLAGQQTADLAKIDDETERQFQEIERHLQTQRDSMNTKLHQHQQQYEQMNDSLQTLLKLLQEQKSGDVVRHQSSSKSNMSIDSSSASDLSNPTSDDDEASSKSDQVHADTMLKSDKRETTINQGRSSFTASTQSSPNDTTVTGTRSMSENTSMSKSSDPSLSTLPSSISTSSNKSRGDTSSTSSTSSRSDNVGTPTTNTKAPASSAKELPGKASVGSEGDGQTISPMGRDTNTPKVEKTRSAQGNVFEPRVVTHDTAGRRVGINNSYVEEHPATVPSSDSVSKGGELEPIQDVLSATEEALIDDVVMPPRGQGLDTVLCLDTSQSMGEDGLAEVKRIALDFVDGIEDVASNQDIEENIAVVKLGGRPRIVHHLSNDYTNVRDAIENLELGGQTPLLESLQICLCSVQGGRGSIVNISGCHLLSPRVIVITDGKPSEGYGGAHDVDSVQQNLRMHVIQVVSEFKARRNNPEFPKPFVWIPAGRADTGFLKSLSDLSGGQFVEGNDVRNLCTYQKIQVTIGKVFAYLHSDLKIESDGDSLGTALDLFALELDQKSKDSVVKGVQAKLDGNDGCGNVRDDNSDFNNVVEYENLPPLGSRVARGPDWGHGNQDSEGPGTIYQHLEDRGPSQGVVLVRWDNGMTERYSYGMNGRYEVFQVTDQPRCPINEEMEIGCEVTRGPDWTSEYSEQDGGPGCVGVVIRKEDDYGVKVRWRETCYVGIYRYKKGGPRDVLLRDPLDILKELTKEDYLEKATNDFTEDEVVDVGHGSRVWIWSWVDDDNNWHEYPPDIVEKLEHAFPSQRSCLIIRNQQSYRVLFKDMVEKGIETKTRRKVKRTAVNVQY